MSIDPDTCTQQELEEYYRGLYPHEPYNPYVWAAMAYFRKGSSFEECKDILDERFKDYNEEREIRARRRQEEFEEQRRLAQEREREAHELGVEEVPHNTF